jgi:hypothetical protein
VHRFVDHESDPVSLDDSLLDERMRELVGPCVELGVRQRPFTVYNGWTVTE